MMATVPVPGDYRIVFTFSSTSVQVGGVLTVDGDCGLLPGPTCATFAPPCHGNWDNYACPPGFQNGTITTSMIIPVLLGPHTATQHKHCHTQ